MNLGKGPSGAARARANASHCSVADLEPSVNGMLASLTIAFLSLPMRVSDNRLIASS